LDGRYDVIASGSLLGIKYRSKKRREKAEPKSIAVGFERQVIMHSLDFEEFLWAKGVQPEVIESLKGYYDRREMLPSVLNDRFGGYLREYMLVGGMPAVVKAYVECGDFGPVQEEQEKILAAYLDDIHKYAEKVDVPKIENCYLAIPRTLAKDNRKFKFSEVEKNGSERKYGESIAWLKDAALAPMCENVIVPEVPLSANVREGWFKLYLSDIGLLSALYGLETKKLLFSGKLTGNAKGGLYENLIAGILERKGYPLRYYKTTDGSREVEFVIEKDGGVIPIEVKSSNGATVSLNETLRMKASPTGTSSSRGMSGCRATRSPCRTSWRCFCNSTLGYSQSANFRTESTQTAETVAAITVKFMV
jgi:hypothetical protein